MRRYVALIVTICAVLSPGLFFSFGYHNDFNAWAYDAQSCCTGHPETLILNAIGRYFGARAQNFQFLTIHDVGDLWIWRLIGIVSTALLASYYLWIVSRQQTPSWTDVLLALMVFTLPTMQFQAIWVSMYMFWTPPILLSLVAAHLFWAAAGRAGWSAMVLPVATGLLALVGGLFFYPASATFVLVPPAHLLLARGGTRARKMAVLTTMILGCAFVILFVFHKFVVLPRMSHVPYLGDYEFSFSDDLVDEIVKRLGVYLKVGAYFWLGLDLPKVPMVIAVGALVALCYCVVKLFRGRLNREDVIDVVLAALLFFVAAGPFVVVHQFSQSFRVTFAMTAIELLVFFWLIRQLPLATSKLAATCAVAGCVLSFGSTYGVAASAAAEYELDRGAVARVPSNQANAIVVLRPNRQRQAFGFDLRGDFGNLAPIDHVFDLLIGTRYNGKAVFDVTTYQLPPVTGAPIALEVGAVMIDTSAIYGVQRFRTFTGRSGFVSAQPRGALGPMYAVDGDVNTFWEVCGSLFSKFPLEFRLLLPSQREVTGYTMSTIEETVRMPNAWEVWVTSDAVNWKRIQSVTKGGGWKTRETRHYDFAPVVATGIKLIINGTDVGPCLRLYEFTPEFAH